MDNGKRVRLNISVKPEFERIIDSFCEKMPGSLDKNIAWEMLIDIGYKEAVKRFGLESDCVASMEERRKKEKS